jgi:hypothetical protein
LNAGLRKDEHLRFYRDIKSFEQPGPVTALFIEADVNPFLFDTPNELRYRVGGNGRR